MFLQHCMALPCTMERKSTSHIILIFNVRVGYAENIYMLTFGQFFCLFSFVIFQRIVLVDSQLKFSHDHQDEAIVGLDISYFQLCA